MSGYNGAFKGKPDTFAIFVHAGAGYHSFHNERAHLSACNDAARAGLAVLKIGGSAVDAVEVAVKVLEDREITNAGYGSNLAMDGVVECDASIVDHEGRSGAVGAVAQVKNPISLARLVLRHTHEILSLRRVPPNLLVAQGATDFAFEHGMLVLPHDVLVSPAARERWMRWRSDLTHAERKTRKGPAIIGPIIPTYEDPDRAYEEATQKRMREEHTRNLLSWAPDSQSHSGSPVAPEDRMDSSGPSEEPSSRTTPESWSAETFHHDPHVDPQGRPGTIVEASHSAFMNSTQTLPTLSSFVSTNGSDQTSRSTSALVNPSPYAEELMELIRPETYAAAHDGSTETESSLSDSTIPLPSLTPSPPTGTTGSPGASTANPPTERLDDTSAKHADHVTDTVGAIAVDKFGRVACGASSGGIGMKHRGRVGPAALVGVGSAVVPVDEHDRRGTSVATVTSGTGEHMAMTMAATVCAERLYHSMRRTTARNSPGCPSTSARPPYESVDDDEAVRSMIESEFMGHPSVRNSHSAGAIGILAVKRTKDGICFYYAHNTDSFAVASMHSDDESPTCTMSRGGNGSIAQGGRAIRSRRKK